MNEQKKYWTDDPELVEKYVLGQLSDEERKRLDAEIADCEPCKAALQRELQLAAGIRRHGRDQLKSRLRLKLRREQSQQIFRYQFVGLAAAVVVIAIGVGVYQVWFSGMEAPKKFKERQIVIKQPEAPQETSKPDDRDGAQGEKDAGKMQKKSALKPTTEKPDVAASQGAAVKKEETITSLSRQGFATLEEGDSETKGRLDKADGGEPVKVKKNIPTQSIWLIGKVVMIENKKPSTLSDVQPQALMGEQSREKATQRNEQRSRTMIVKRGNVDEQIVLQQKSFRDLPRSRQTQIGRKNLVETLVQHNADGLRLTIYSDVISAAEIENATVETAGSDSIIVETGSQRIYYKLPASFQSSTRTRR
ncbi:MAG: zf-HC2 domain-containing protein [Bacteroidota bacterium]